MERKQVGFKFLSEPVRSVEKGRWRSCPYSARKSSVHI